MPYAKRQRRAHTEEWRQLRLLTTWPEQTTYELIRPLVLFGDVPDERARETGAPARTLHRKAARFDVEGMASLFSPKPAQRRDLHRSLPTPMRQALVDLKAEHPAFRPHELATICYVRFGRKPSPHTVEKVLADGPPAPSSPGRLRRYPPYAEIADPPERRLAIIHLHAEGWNHSSIAAYLQISRTRVHQTLRRWVAEGVAGLPDKSHANRHRVRTVRLETQETVRQLQQNPNLGEFRIHAALKQLGIHLRPRTCGRILALNRRLYGLPTHAQEPREPRTMPFKASRRHEYWSVDLCYIEHHQIAGLSGPFYVISILENFSRAILASDIFQTQDLTAYLIVLYAAIRQHGAPEALVSDGGGIFRAKQAKAIYAALDIRKEQSAKRQAWQNYIETAFNVQRRMADAHFASATTWEQAKSVHARWVADYNYQPHYAHRRREDQRHSPAEVLDWVHGVWRSPEVMHRLFYATRFARQLDRFGSVRFRHWRLYGERALARYTATVWLYNETLTVEFANTPLAQYTVAYQPDKTHFRQIHEPRIYATQYQSPQLDSWELGAVGADGVDGEPGEPGAAGTVEWYPIHRLPTYATRRKHARAATRAPACIQLALFA